MINLINYTIHYNNKTKPSILNYINTNTNIIIQKHNTLQLNYNTQNITPTNITKKNITP